MTAPRPPLPGRAFLGLLIVALGLVSWVLYGVAAGRENHSFRPDGGPPTYVRVQAGHTYWLAVPGGVGAMRSAGGDPFAPSCTANQPGQAPGALQVTPVIDKNNTETKFANRIGSFAAAASGRLHVECSGVGPVYVDNAADAPYDTSGLWLVLASAALVLGLPLTLSGLRRPRRPDAGPAAPDPAPQPLPAPPS